MKQRMVPQDIAKGLAMLAVVQMHTFRLPFGIGSVVILLLGSAMPFFVFMSGYNYRNKGLSPWKMMTSKVGYLLKTFLICSFIIFVVMGAYFLIRKEAAVQELLVSYAGILALKWVEPFSGIRFPTACFRSA